jgi:ketosteroid isomerase-like protein
MNDQHWIDKLAIQELIYSHCDAITRGDLAALETLYAPDAIWEHTPLFGMRTESAREFFDFLAAVTPTAEILLQTAQNPVVRLLDEVTARATTTIFELSRGREQPSMVQYGMYYDDLSKSTGKWLFTHRRFVQCYVEHDTARGDVPTTRASLLESWIGT